MRPTSLADFVGQGHLLGAGKLLERVLQGRDLPSLILWGPPGTGKTTLARILTTRVRARFVQLSATSAGVRDIREVVTLAAERRDQFAEKTILFIDEIHRFNKNQQDALLPHVEAGTVTLVGATTENPSFEVNAPLLSRCRVVRLEPLGDHELALLARRALTDPKGLGGTPVVVPEPVLALLVAQSHGDARRLLNTLEVAVSIASPGRSAPAGSGPAPSLGPDGEAPREPVELTVALVEEAMQQKTLLYDKAGEEHYGVISAFIKSMRGSDPDAAVYWMTRMLEAGEDPLFLLRRMVIFASEDIGNADPQALVVATSALAAFQLVGMPEGGLPLTQAAIYLACAAKSNSTLTTYAAARRAVSERGSLPVPLTLRNAATALDRRLGYGRGYKYPHDFAGHYVVARYLPDELVGEQLYRPSDSGYEVEIQRRLMTWRGARRSERSSDPAASEAERGPGADDGEDE